MRKQFVSVGLVLMLLGACGSTAQPASGHQVGGSVRGLWDGADGVALRLQADGVDTLLTVSTNGTFHFKQQLSPDASYTVIVANNPVQHTCVVDGGGNGTVEETDVMNVSVACSGPAVTIVPSGLWTWTFDPAKPTQMLVGSVVMQDVSLTVSGSSLSSASVNGTTVSIGEPAASIALPLIALPLGSTTVPVGITTTAGLSKTYQLVFNRGASVIEQIAYGKASNTEANDQFGFRVSVSGDTLAVGARLESSAARGVNGNQGDNSAGRSGAVYVFVRSGTTWTQQAYLKASNTDAGDLFGSSVSLSGDTLAVGAPTEASAAIGVNGFQADNSASAAGAVYVFVRRGTTWAQQAYLKASNTGMGDLFGDVVSLSGDTLAIGARGESSAATGVDGNQTDNSAIISGAVYMFVRNGTTWAQQAYLKASNTEAFDSFGTSVSLSGDTLAVGASGEDSAATGVNGNQADNSAEFAGAAYVFVRAGTTWTQQAYLKASNRAVRDEFGFAISVSGDTLAVGTTLDFTSGSVYMFVRNGTTWMQQAYLRASRGGPFNSFGDSVSVFGDVLAVGAEGDTSDGSGGAVYMFVRSGTTWTQQAYLKASNTGGGFGDSVSLSGHTVAVGAFVESSAATGIDGNQTDNSASQSGAVYVFQ